jgi:hypothetical protein
MSGKPLYRHAHRPALERLEDRTVPSTVAGDFSTANGVWRWDSVLGWGHISNMEATQLAVDGAGDVFGKFADGLWRWDATTMGWQKLSGLSVTEFQVTSGGVLYADFGMMGTWRWSFAGWQQITSQDVSGMAVSDSDAFFGRYDAGVMGTWRWTPMAGWSLLTGNRPDVLRADGMGDFVGVYNTFIGATMKGSWRWSPTTGWARLSTAAPNTMDVSTNGVVYEDRGSAGIWRYDPSMGSPMFTKISDYWPASFQAFNATPDGSLFFVDSFTGKYIGWYYNSATASWSNPINTSNTIGQVVTGKDGDQFIDYSTLGVYQWSPTIALRQLGDKIPSVLASQA